MHPGRIVAAFCFAALLNMRAIPARAVGPTLADVPVMPRSKNRIVVAVSGQEMTISTAALADLPSVQVSVPAGTADGAPEQTFGGPLLWTVLVQVGAVDPTKQQNQVRGTVTIIGHDDNASVLALGELSPEFKGEQVILAIRKDGQPLHAALPRLVVPGDKHDGRGVADVIRIVVTLLPAKQ